MPHEEQYFTAADGVRLYSQRWMPETGSRATVVFVHGFTEHSGRYADVAAELNRHGVAMYAMDLRGHGRSDGERVYIRDFAQFLDDLAVFLKMVRQHAPAQPLFLLGHSMGGTIVARFVETRQPDVEGLVLSGAAVTVGRSVFPLLRRLAWLIALVLPRLKVVRMGFGWVSRDPQVVADFRSDPLVFHERFPVKIGAEILRAARQVQEDAGHIRLPLLILQGTDDRVVDAEGLQRLAEHVGSTDKTLRLYPGLYHDVLHEPEKEQVWGDLVAWILARSAARGSQ